MRERAGIYIYITFLSKSGIRIDLLYSIRYNEKKALEKGDIIPQTDSAGGVFLT